jgi:membrane protein implicated in regulation of membrane protease activity
MLWNPTLFWLISGALLCLTELFLPTAFVALMMGLSAFAVAGISVFFPYLNLQIFLWMVLSVVFVLLSRCLVPKGKARAIADSQEAKTLTEILPGETGRVIYEGNSWQARCEDTFATIPPNQNVIVVGRKGTTLIVVPENLLHS